MRRRKIDYAFVACPFQRMCWLPSYAFISLELRLYTQASISSSRGVSQSQFRRLEEVNDERLRKPVLGLCSQTLELGCSLVRLDRSFVLVLLEESCQSMREGSEWVVYAELTSSNIMNVFLSFNFWLTRYVRQPSSLLSAASLIIKSSKNRVVRQLQDQKEMLDTVLTLLNIFGVFRLGHKLSM